MKIKLEVPLVICLMGYNSGKQHVPKEDVVEHFEDQINKLNEKIRTSDSDELVEKSKERIKSKKESLQKVKSIKKWDEFCEKVLENDYKIYGGAEE